MNLDDIIELVDWEAGHHNDSDVMNQKAGDLWGIKNVW